MRELAGVPDQDPAGGVLGNDFVQPGRSGDRDVGIAHQCALDRQYFLRNVSEAFMVVHAVVHDLAVRQGRRGFIPERMLNNRNELTGVGPVQHLASRSLELVGNVYARGVVVDHRCALGVKVDLEKATGAVELFDIEAAAWIIDQVDRYIKNTTTGAGQCLSELLRTLVSEVPVDHAPENVIGQILLLRRWGQ
ncbi:hypothetical protein D3C84_822890 [compost metagenome]